jgi:tetratricopeptide (TPR) repeat protein
MHMGYAHARDLAAGVVLGDLNVNYHAAVHQVRIERREVVWPVSVGRVPPAADCFQARPIGVDLATAATGGGTVVVCQVLSGLGGVGKTQLAAHYAHGRWDAKDVDLLVWISAASRVQIIDGYAEAAVRIGLVDDDGDAERAAARLLSWLASTDRSWLIVLDDLAQAGDLRGLWPPAAAGGATVITTRRRDDALDRAGRIIDVGLFTPAEARAYLTAKLAKRSATGDGDSVDEIDGLAADLGLLPLALAQAATYMLDRRLTCAAYRARYADRKRTLPQLLPEDGSLPDEHAATVAVTWSLSIDAADALTPAGLARPLLQLASLLGPNDIPAAVFTTDAVLVWLASRRTVLAADSDGAETAGVTVTGDDVNDGLGNLHRLNLATVADDGDTVRVHGLVRRATREATHRDLSASEAWRQLVHAAANAVVAVGNQGHNQTEHRDLTEMLWHNARTLIDHGGPDLWTPDGHTVLYGLGMSLGSFGHVRAAAEYFHDLAQTAAERLGPTHADTFLARAKHARCLGALGHPARAAAALGLVIADRTRAWGEDDAEADNLIDLANQATYLRHAGDTKEALRAFTQLVRCRAELHGPNAPETLITRANLAGCRGEHGDIPGAIRAYAELVPLFRQAFGDEAGELLWVYGELAAWRGELNPAAGVTDMARLLSTETRIAGAYASSTIATRLNLTRLLGRAGQVDQAISDLTYLITDYEQHIDLDHPHVLTARNELAELLIVKRRDFPVGYRVLKDLLAAQSRALGADHPGTARTTTMVTGIEKRFRRCLTERLRAAADGPYRTTLARLADDARVEIGWLRRALGALVDTGALRLVRSGPAGNAQVDLPTIADHARFQVMVGSRIVTD